MLTRNCADIALSNLPFELTLDLYQTIQLGNFQIEMSECRFKTSKIKPQFSIQ